MNGKVYLIQQPSIKKNGKLPNLEPLFEHGEICVCLETGVYPSYYPGDALDAIERRLEDFDYEKDMLAWVGGDTLAALLVGEYLSRCEYPYFWWLKFDRPRDPHTGKRDTTAGYYRKIKIPLYEENENEVDEVI